mgnify:CR=1 FL=1
MATLMSFGLYYIEHNQLLTLESREIITSDIVESRIKDISELATVSYKYKDVLQLRDYKEFSGVKIPFSEKSFILVYKGEIKAGVDLSDMKVEVVNEGKVFIEIPTAKILTHTVDEKSVEVVDENDGLFNELKYEDFLQVIGDKKILMEKELATEGFLEDANGQVEKVIRGLLLDSEIKSVEIKFIK